MASDDKATDEKGDLQDSGLTIRKLAKIWKVNHKTIRRMVDAGEIPGHFKTGRLHHFHGPTVLTWMSEGQVPVSRARRRAKK